LMLMEPTLSSDTTQLVMHRLAKTEHNH